MVAGPADPGRGRRYGGRIDLPPDPSETDPTGDEAAVAAAVEAYYAAFEATDLDAMSDLWVHDDTVACTHPGWARLQGWAATSASFFAIFDQSPPLQVFVTDQRVHVAGDVAWVTLDENLLGAGSEPSGTTVATVKVLRRTDAGWRVVVHHGSVVVSRPG